MNPALALAIAAVPAFLASIVEFVEAFTIVLAVGNVRGWRAPLWGTFAAVVALAVIVAVFGTPLIIYKDQIAHYFQFVVGTCLLLFGIRWLRKSILRFAGIVALHDEEAAYQKEVAALRAQGLSTGWDRVGFWLAFNAVLLEGLEAAFIVIALGTQSSDALVASVVGAAAAFTLTMVVGLLLRKPLTVVPENWMKFVVGAMLVTFGIYWGAEGFAVKWMFGTSTLLAILAGVCLASWVAVRMLNVMLPQGARVAGSKV